MSRAKGWSPEQRAMISWISSPRSRGNIFLGHDRAHFVGFLLQPGDLIGACLDQWVELLGALPEDLHCQGVTLCIVRYSTQGIQRIGEYSFTVAQIAIGIGDSHSQCLEGLRHISQSNIKETPPKQGL